MNDEERAAYTGAERDWDSRQQAALLLLVGDALRAKFAQLCPRGGLPSDCAKGLRKVGASTDSQLSSQASKKDKQKLGASMTAMKAGTADDATRVWARGELARMGLVKVLPGWEGAVVRHGLPAFYLSAMRLHAMYRAHTDGMGECLDLAGLKAENFAPYTIDPNSGAPLEIVQVEEGVLRIRSSFLAHKKFELPPTWIMKCAQVKTKPVKQEPDKMGEEFIP